MKRSAVVSELLLHVRFLGERVGGGGVEDSFVQNHIHFFGLAEQKIQAFSTLCCEGDKCGEVKMNNGCPKI